jgi:hypothetical protein
MLNYDTLRLEKSCGKLIDALGKKMSWKWDDRFETALAEFNVKEKEKIHQILVKHMDQVWDTDNSGEAPDLVKMIINYFGGMNPRQKLLTSDPDQDGMLLCAWWPWGNGKTISIRLSVFANSLSDEDNKELSQLFKGWFDI